MFVPSFAKSNNLQIAEFFYLLLYAELVKQLKPSYSQTDISLNDLEMPRVFVTIVPIKVILFSKNEFASSKLVFIQSVDTFLFW